MMAKTPEWQTYVNWLTERGLTQPRWRDDIKLATVEMTSEHEEATLSLVFLSDVPLTDQESDLVGKMAAALDLAESSWRIASCSPDKNFLADGIPPAEVLDDLGSDMWTRLPTSAVYVAFGPLATRIACGKGSFRSMRGQLQTTKGTRVMPTYHPRDMAKQPALKRDVWTDLQACSPEGSA